MSAWLYLRPEGLEASNEQWPVLFWSAAEPLRDADLAQAAAALQGRGIALILPMEACSAWPGEPWPGRRRPSSQALAYAIEDQLAQELESLHLGVGPLGKDRRQPLLVTDKARFGAILELLEGQGLQIASVRVDAQLLPRDQAYAAWWAGRWLLGGAGQPCLTLSAAAAEVLREQLPGPRCWLDEQCQEQVRRLLERGNSEAIDLLQGDFCRRPRRWPWSWLAVAGLLVVALDLGFSLARSQYLERASEQLHEQSVQRFRQLYPEQTRIVDLAAQLKAIEAQGSVAASRMAALVQLAEQVLGGSSVEVQRLDYRQGEGWKLLLSSDSFTELEQLRERAAQRGQPIRLGNASRERERVQALLTLEEPGT